MSNLKDIIYPVLEATENASAQEAMDIMTDDIGYSEQEAADLINEAQAQGYIKIHFAASIMDADDPDSAVHTVITAEG